LCQDLSRRAQAFIKFTQEFTQDSAGFAKAASDLAVRQELGRRSGD
jgi:hypothetical protein